MKAYATENVTQESWARSGIPIDQYYSVEISLDGLEHLHQFKIWNIEPHSMCVLVKEDSTILESLKVGDRMVMRYYGSDTLSPPAALETEIRHITREDHGRFKGHCLIGLAILADQNDQKIH